MKSKATGNICIRIDRDESQIRRCKSLLEELGTDISVISKIIHLAGNEVRLRILLLIQAEHRLCVCDLSEILDMKIPAVSQHLRKMKDAGMLTSQREGTVIYYRISGQSSNIIGSLLQLVPHYDEMITT